MSQISIQNHSEFESRVDVEVLLNGFLQMGSKARVEVEVTRLWGEEEINTAVVHPSTAAEGCEVKILQYH